MPTWTAPDRLAHGGPGHFFRSIGRDGGGLLVLAALGVNILGLALPIFILQVYDRILPNAATTTLLILVLGLVVVILCDVTLRILRASVASWNGARFEHLLRCRVMERLLGAPLDRIEQHRPGAFFERINAIGVVRDFHASQRLLLAVDMPFALIFLAVIADLGGWLVLVPLSLAVGFGLIALGLGSALRASSELRVETDRRRYDFLIQVMRGIDTVKALGLNMPLLRRAELRQEESANAVERVAYHGALMQGLATGFSQLTLVATVGFGAWLVLDGMMTTGALAACALLSGRALQPLQSAVGVWANFQRVQIADAGLDEIMALPQEGEGATLKPEITGRLEFKHASLQHDPTRPILVKDVTLAVEPGEIVGIEGATGSGKTSLLKSVLGLVGTVSGTILVDGVDVAEIDPDWLRSYVAYLPRHGVTFAGSILENLTSFQEDRVDEALSLSEKIGLDSLVKRLPEGYDTRLGVDEALPAGLRQRIAIVRELVKGPTIVLFDDAGHDLDTEACLQIRGLLTELRDGASVLIVSEQPLFLQQACRTYRLSRGRLVPRSNPGADARAKEVAV